MPLCHYSSVNVATEEQIPCQTLSLCFHVTRVSTLLHVHPTQAKQYMVLAKDQQTKLLECIFAIIPVHNYDCCVFSFRHFFGY